MTTQITDHIERAKKKLIEQYKGKPNLEKLLKIYSIQVQELEDVAFDLFTARQISTAIGIQLDKIGEIVIFSRNGLSDEDYRKFLFGKAWANSSEGRHQRIIDIFEIVTSSSFVLLRNIGEGHIELSGDIVLTQAEADLIFDVVFPSLGAAIALDSIISVPDPPFALGSVVTGNPPIGLGYSTVAAPTSGGKYSTVFERS